MALFVDPCFVVVVVVVIIVLVRRACECDRLCVLCADPGRGTCGVGSNIVAGKFPASAMIAAVCVIPLLVAIAAFISILGGYLAAVPSGMVTDAEYILGLRTFFVPYNVFMMFVKAVAFAFILTSISCIKDSM